MSNVPKARAQLFAISEELERMGVAVEAAEIRLVIQEYLTRQSPIRRAPRKAFRLSPSIAAEIQRMAEADPRKSQLEIATALGVNPGRVSEVLNNKRVIS